MIDIADFESYNLQGIIKVLMQLDNEIFGRQESERDMPSTFRQVYNYIDKNGNKKEIRINAHDKVEADQKFQAYLQREDASEKMTFNDFIEEHYLQNFLPNKESTRTTYIYYLDNYIRPHIGEKDIDRINVGDIQRIMDWLARGERNGLRKNISSTTIDRVTGLISHIFRIAIEMGFASSNPVKKTLLKNNGAKSGHHTALSDEDIHHVKVGIPELEDERERLLMGLMAYTGIRPEEIRGLTWDDVNLDERYMEIVRAVTYTGRNRAVTIDTPKTDNSCRTVFIPDALYNIFSGVENKKGFIVSAIKDHEKPICESSWLRLVDRSFEHLGIKNKCTPYDFRTTFATQCKESGMTNSQVADLLGHADTRMVDRIYARRRHESIMKQGAALNAMNKEYA